MIGRQSIGGPKDLPRNIGMKDMGGLNQSTINGRMGAHRGIKAREIRRVMADLKAREVSELEREGRFRCLPEEGGVISLQL